LEAADNETQGNKRNENDLQQLNAPRRKRAYSGSIAPKSAYLWVSDLAVA